jgi:hypothetical protein
MPPCPIWLVVALLSVAPAGTVTPQTKASGLRLQKGTSAGAVHKGGIGSTYNTMMAWWCGKPERMGTQECVRSKLYQQLRETHGKEDKAILLDRLRNVSPAATHRHTGASGAAFCGSVGEGHARLLLRCHLQFPYSQHRRSKVPGGLSAAFAPSVSLPEPNRALLLPPPRCCLCSITIRSWFSFAAAADE